MCRLHTSFERRLGYVDPKYIARSKRDLIVKILVDMGTGLGGLNTIDVNTLASRTGTMGHDIGSMSAPHSLHQSVKHLTL